jgi:hypothetical protein
MKRLSFILSFLVVSLLFAGGIAMGADVAPETAMLASVAFNAVASLVFYTLNRLGVMPEGIAGNYVGMNAGAGAQMVQVINDERERADYTIHSTSDRFRGKKLVPDILRMEALFNANNNKLRFNTYLGDPGTVTPTERRLDRNDAFIATRWRLGLMVVTPSKTNGQVVTYPNIFLFGAAAAADLWSFYNGILRMNINDEDHVKAFPISRFLDIPETQQTAGTNYDKRSGDTSGLIACIPNIIIDGDKKNEIEVEFPTHVAWAGATPKTGGDVHYAVLELHGYKALNGSKGA